MSDALSGVFAALADPTRRRLLDELLTRADGATATELARLVPVTRQAVVKHLQVLVRAELAGTRRDGREVRYLAQVTSARTASAWIDGRALAWERRLERLGALVAEGASGEPTRAAPRSARRE